MIVKWTRTASGDRENQIDWYAERNPQAAVRMAGEIVKAALQLQNFPFSGRIGQHLGTHELSVQRTPFMIVYRVIGETVEILRLMHTSQRWPAAIDFVDN